MHCRVWRPAVSLLCLAASLDAQAWLPPKGEGYVSVGYQTMFIGHHLSSFGKRTGTNDNIRSHASSIGLTYGITDRLAVAANIPYIATRYTGTTPHSHFDSPTRLDDGTYHGVFQDFRFAAHYNLWRGDVMVTPFVTLVLPSHRYDTFGHAAPGRDLREFQLGFNLGRQLRPLLPRAYTDLRYAYTFAQDVAGINTDRSNIDLEVGYFLTPRLLLRGFGMWQRSHDGLENSPNFELPPEHFHLHDRVWRAHYFRLGAGAGVSLTPTVDLYTAVVTTPTGKNAETSTAIGVGISWRFTRRRSEDNASPDAYLKREDKPGDPASVVQDRR